MSGFLLAIDQGTTSSRAMVFDRHSRVVARASRELEQFFPAPGWVEHDPDALWRDVEAVTREALAALPDGAAIAAIGLTNQRETTLLWNRRTGRPLHRAIVWQDRRTAPLCEQLAGQAAMVQARTGLLLDPYFSATKLRWLLDTVPGAQEAACRGELAFGTVDSWLL